MIYKIVRTEEEFLQLEEPWNKLQHKSVESTCYNSFLVAYFWYKFLVPKSQLCIVCVLHNEEVVGIAPLCINKRSHWRIYNVREIEVLGWGDYKTFLYNEDFPKRSAIFKSFFDAIESINYQWDKMVIKNLRQDNYLTHFLKRNPLHQYLWSYNEAPCISFKNYKTFDNYKKEFRDKRIEANAKKLSKKESFSFEFYHSISDELLQKMMACHIKEKEILNIGSATRTSPFSSSGRQSFHASLLTKGNYGSAAVLFNSTGDIMAYEMYYYYNGVYYCWNIGYDPKYTSLGVARILNKKVIEFLFSQESVIKYDYGAGGYRWKYQNTTEFCLLYRLEFHNIKSKKVQFIQKVRKILLK